MSVLTDTTAEPTATITYKTNPVPIEFDLYSPTERFDKPGALIIYYHAGATYLGSRKLGFPAWLRDGCNKRVSTSVSTSNSSSALSLRSIDAVFISGGSAGGYLTFQAGHLLTPRPSGLVAMYGDCFVGDCDVEKHSAQIEQYFQGSRKPITGRPFKDGTEVHSMFYHYLMRNGELLKRTFGVESMDEVASRPDLHYLFLQFSVKDTCLPIVLAHGTSDNAVPHKQSIFFSEYLTSKGLYNELYLLEGRDHFWDVGEEDDVLEVKAKIWAFLDKLVSH